MPLNCASLRSCSQATPVESGGGPPQSRTLARYLMTPRLREASWSAPVLWRFGQRGQRETTERLSTACECGWRGAPVSATTPTGVASFSPALADEIGLHCTGSRCRAGRMKSGGGPPQSRTLARWQRLPNCAKRPGVRQPSGALGAPRRKRDALERLRPDAFPGLFLPDSLLPSAL